MILPAALCVCAFSRAALQAPVAGLASMVREEYYAKGFGLSSTKEFEGIVSGLHIAHLTETMTLNTGAGVQATFPAGSAVFANSQGYAVLIDCGWRIVYPATVPTVPGDTPLPDWEHVCSGAPGSWPYSPQIQAKLSALASPVQAAKSIASPVARVSTEPMPEPQPKPKYIVRPRLGFFAKLGHWLSGGRLN